MADKNECFLEKFPFISQDKIRYSDTDRQGHVNNAVFSTFFETGRVEMLYNPQAPMNRKGTSFVIADLSLEYLREITWPGMIQIGSGITRIGRSSVAFEQALFQNGICTARSTSVIVLMDESTRKSTPLDEETRAGLGRFLFV